MRASITLITLIMLTGCASVDSQSDRINGLDSLYQAYRHCTQSVVKSYLNKPAWAPQAIANQAETRCHAQSEAYREALQARYQRNLLDPQSARQSARVRTLQMTIKVHAHIVRYVTSARKS